MKELENISFPQLLHRVAGRYADRPAVWYEGKSWTYAQLEQSVAAYGAELCSVGVKRGDHVAVWAENSPQALSAFYAVMSMGAVAVMLNTSLTLPEMERMLRFSNSVCLIVGELYKRKLQKEELCEIREAFPDLSGIYTLPGAETEGFRGLNTAARTPDPAMLERFRTYEAAVRPEDTACLLFTSGTTGKSKGVLSSHYSRVNSGIQQASDLRATCEDRFCGVLPMFHCFSISANLISCLSVGGCMCIPLSRRSANVVRTIRQAGCTIFNSVPTLYYAIMAKPDFCTEDYASVRTGIIGGAGYTPEEFERIERAFSMTLMSSLGQTEATAGLTICEPEDPLSVRSTTVGHFMSHVEGKIADPDTGRTLPAGRVGEICVRGYLVMQGYYRQPRATERAVDADGWLHTGDLGVLDDRGYLTVKGRLKELIIRAGENISPMEIEQALLELPQIADCKVLGVPSEHYGEEICACLVLHAGETLSREQMEKGLAPLLAPYKTPAYVCIWDRLPLNATGKIDMHTLARRAEEDIAAGKAI